MEFINRNKKQDEIAELLQVLAKKGIITEADVKKVRSNFKTK